MNITNDNESHEYCECHEYKLLDLALFVTFVIISVIRRIIL